MHAGILSTTLTLAAAAMTPQVQPQSPASPVDAVPVSKAALHPFPYLRWPGEFVPKDSPVEHAVGHFRFWDGTALEDVEGRTYLATLVERDGGRTFNEPLLRRTIEADLGRMGAVRIASGQVPSAALDTINDSDKRDLAPGLGDIRHDPVETWVIRRPDRQIWVQYTGGRAQASVAIVAMRPK